MRLLLLIVCFLSLVAQNAFAQETFEIRNASREYDLKVRLASCGEADAADDSSNTCHGAARISLYRKQAKSPFQVLHLSDVELYRDTIAYNSKLTSKPRQLYGEEYGFVFDDFDFDGHQDLAICNGRNGGYGGPSYNVYLFNPRTEKFASNRKLSELTEGAYLGLFLLQPKRKQLVVFSKSGCCYHETETYRVVKQRPVLIEKEIEDAMGEQVVITTRRLVNGKWRKQVRTEAKVK
jgi:hypothetical protein